jgi:desulfoferrodoxin (superoxide reductase-like protein)
MAQIIVRVITIYAPKSISDAALGKKMTSAVSTERKKMSKTKSGGAFQNCNIHHVPTGRNRYKAVLTFLRFR